MEEDRRILTGAARILPKDVGKAVLVLENPPSHPELEMFWFWVGGAP